jgi:Spy/CpxP family protein refolding chaperone
MKRMNLTQLLAATLVVFSASSMAFADPAATDSSATAGKGKSHTQCQAKHAEMRQKFAQELGLTSDQQKKIDALRADFKKAHKSELEAKRAQYMELRTLKKNGAPQTEIDAKRQAIRQQFSGLKADREKLHEQIKATLTPDQVQKLEAMKAKHHKHWNKGGNKPDQKQ